MHAIPLFFLSSISIILSIIIFGKGMALTRRTPNALNNHVIMLSLTKAEAAEEKAAEHGQRQSKLMVQYNTRWVHKVGTVPCTQVGTGYIADVDTAGYSWLQCPHCTQRAPPVYLSCIFAVPRLCTHENISVTPLKILCINSRG